MDLCYLFGRLVRSKVFCCRNSYMHYIFYVMKILSKKYSTFYENLSKTDLYSLTSYHINSQTIFLLSLIHTLHQLNFQWKLIGWHNLSLVVTHTANTIFIIIIQLKRHAIGRLNVAPTRIQYKPTLKYYHNFTKLTILEFIFNSGFT